MSFHRFVLTLGSNAPSLGRIAWVSQQLERLFGAEALRFSTPRISSPIAFGLSDAPFTDVVVIGYTSLGQEQVRHLLKGLELEAGRTPEQRVLHPEVIPVDVDLIVWDQQVLKPKDLDRPYLLLGLEELGEELLGR